MKFVLCSLSSLVVVCIFVSQSWAQTESSATNDNAATAGAVDPVTEADETESDEEAPTEEASATSGTTPDLAADQPTSETSSSTSPGEDILLEVDDSESEEESEESEEASDSADGLERYFKISGFINATFFLQNSSFGFCNGQCSEYPLPDESGTDPWFMDGDMRNTRLRLDSKAPPVRDVVFGGSVEVDFFGGFPTGSFADEAPLPRLRLAYATVDWRWLTVRIGQSWSPLFGNVPDSLSHIAFPLGYGGAGMIGWRFPGIYVDFNFTDDDDAVQVQAQLAVFRGSWNGPETIITNSLSGGNADIPQFEARLNLRGEGDHGIAWNFYLVGHYDRKDLTGVGVVEDDDDQEYLHGYAVEGGGRFNIWRFSLALNSYYGHSIGQQFGHITQFGDIAGWGLWTQLGFNIYEGLSIHVFYGISDPDNSDVIDTYSDPDFDTDNKYRPRLRNQIVSLMMKYTIGPFSVGLEWLYGRLDYQHRDLASGLPAARSVQTAEGHQLSLSGLYRF